MRPLPFLLALLALGCSTEDATRPTSTVVDSAGVEIVFSAEPRWGDGGWTVSDRPLVDIGVVEGAEEYLLDNVRDARLVGDGGIVVANEGDNSIRRYDAEGRFLWRAGRSGDGPGEYRQLWFVRVMSGGRILGVQSRELWPDYVYDPDGEFLRAIDKPETPSGLVLFMTDVWPDGRHLFIDAPQGYPVRRDTWTDSADVYVTSEDGRRLDRVLRLPAATFVEVDEGQRERLIFAPSISQAVGARGFYAGYADEYDIGWYDLDGRLIRRVRRAFAPRAVTERDMARYEERYPERANDRELHYADRFPAYFRMLVDGERNLWVARYVGDPALHATLWDVFDPDGVWLGTVRTPDDLRITDIGARRIVGIWSDPLDVEHVRVYGLSKDVRIP